MSEFIVYLGALRGPDAAGKPDAAASKALLQEVLDANGMELKPLSKRVRIAFSIAAKDGRALDEDKAAKVIERLKQPDMAGIVRSAYVKPAGEPPSF